MGADGEGSRGLRGVKDKVNKGLDARADSRLLFSSSRSSQSSLSIIPSDEEDVDMNTRAKARRLLEEEEEEDEGEEERDEEEEEEDTELAEGSDEEGEAAANGSASEDDEEQVEEEDEEEEENDELEDDGLSEAEELEEGDGDDYEADEAPKEVAKARKPPARSAANSFRKRKAIEELSRSASEDSSPVARVPTSKASARKITLRISPSKNGKGKKIAKEKKARQSKAATNKRRQFDEDEDDEEEEEKGDAEEDDMDSWDEFENDQSFAQLPKTARQLAKEKANQGATESGSELQELPVVEDSSSKKSKLTESEIALRKSEMSRRRRNQTEKKLEDDKIETINRLLKKQVTRRSNREKAGQEDSEADMEDDETTGIVEKKVVDPRQVRLELKQAPRPFLRYIQSTRGSTLSLPVEEEAADGQPYRTKWEAIFKKEAAV